MISDTKCRIFGIALTAGIVFAAQAPAHAENLGHRSPALSGTVLASRYDPYTLGWSPCPQGAPDGGPKCHKLIPRTGTHPQAG